MCTNFSFTLRALLYRRRRRHLRVAAADCVEDLRHLLGCEPLVRGVEAKRVVGPHRLDREAHPLPAARDAPSHLGHRLHVKDVLALAAQVAARVQAREGAGLGAEREAAVAAHGGQPRLARAPQLVERPRRADVVARLELVDA